MPELILPKSFRESSGPDNVLTYFERFPDGRLIVPPVAYAPTPVCRLPEPHTRDNPGCLCGYVRREVSRAKELERISKRFELQKKSEFARIDEKHQKRIAAKMAEISAALSPNAAVRAF